MSTLAPPLRVLLALFGVAGVLTLAIGARPAVAGPVGGGFAPLGGGLIASGAHADASPAPVVHNGRVYVANVLRDRDHFELVVDRVNGDPGRWQRVGQVVLNVDINAAVHRPRLLSTGPGGVLYLTWVEGHIDRGRLMVARLDESEPRFQRWQIVGGPGPAVNAMGLPPRPILLGGRLAVVYRPVHFGRIMGLPTERGWQLTDLTAGTAPELGFVDDVATYRDTLYLLFRRMVLVPAHMDDHEHYEPERMATHWWLLRARLGDDNRLRLGGAPIPVARTDTQAMLTLRGQDGARPLLAWQQDNVVAVAQLAPAGDMIALIGRIEVRARFLGENTRFRELAVTQLGDDVAVTATHADGGIDLFRVERSGAAPRIRYDRTPAGYASNADAIAGPAGQLILTYLDGGRPIALAFTHDR